MLLGTHVHGTRCVQASWPSLASLVFWDLTVLRGSIIYVSSHG